MNNKKYFIILLTVCLQISASGQISPQIPRPKDDILLRAVSQRNGSVSDYENLFTKSEIFQLDSLITDFQSRTTIEIAVVSLDDLFTDKENFDDYTLTLANAWGIGQEEKNNGILVAISKKFRQMRIQNGKGIEKIFSDDETKQIIDQYFIPKFKNGHHFEGTKDGISALIKILQTKQQQYDSANILINKIIALLEQNNTEALQQLTTEKIYCYLCYSETPENEPILDKQTFYAKFFNTIFNEKLLSRLKRDEKEIFITSDYDNAIMVLYTIYRNNEFGDGHEGAQFNFWLKEENGTLKLNGIETIP